MKTQATAELLQALLEADGPRKKAALRLLRGETSPGQPCAGPILVNMGQAARLMGICRTSMWKLVSTGRIRPVEIMPGLRRIRVSDLQNLAGVTR